MNRPLPEHHSNPETYKEEPVYIFTDKAIIPPPKAASSSNSGDQPEEPTPPVDQPAEEGN
jgi:hypothetical protein